MPLKSSSYRYFNICISTQHADMPDNSTTAQLWSHTWCSNKYDPQGLALIFAKWLALKLKICWEWDYHTNTITQMYQACWNYVSTSSFSAGSCKWH